MTKKNLLEKDNLLKLVQVQILMSENKEVELSFGLSVSDDHEDCEERTISAIILQTAS